MYLFMSNLIVVYISCIYSGEKVIFAVCKAINVLQCNHSLLIDVLQQLSLFSLSYLMFMYYFFFILQCIGERISVMCR